MSAETREKSFDPSRYLTRIAKRVRDADGSWRTSDTEYLEVKWRLLWLRTECPEATIDTELVSHADGMAVFRARVTISGGGSATGWGHETSADFGDYLEKAETKALGRALAAIGYGTQFCEDFEFEQAHASRGSIGRIVDSPVSRAAVSGTEHSTADESERSGAESEPSAGRQSTIRRSLTETEPQVKAIYAIARGPLSLDDDEISSRCRGRYGCVPQALTRGQASEFIDTLKLSAPTAV